MDVLDDYLASLEENRQRNGRLYVSDVGQCPRKVAYDLLDAEKDEEEEDAKRNRLRKFKTANILEEIFKDALEWKGVLVAYQPVVTIGDRENWGGRADIIARYPGVRVIEHKAEFSNAYKFYARKPSEQHEHQASIYDHYLDEEFELDGPPLLRYTRMPDTKYDKNAGFGLNAEHLVKMDWAITSALMDELQDVRQLTLDVGHTALSAIDRLPKTWKMTDKVRGKQAWKTVREVPDWRCSYCSYAGSCEPDMDVRTIASLNDAGSYDLKVMDIDVTELSRFVSNERKVWE
jgi:hypothetical protein